MREKEFLNEMDTHEYLVILHSELCNIRNGLLVSEEASHRASLYNLGCLITSVKFNLQEFEENEANSCTSTKKCEKKSDKEKN